MKKLLTALFLLVLAAPATMQALQPFEDYLPSDTAFVAGTRDFDRLCKESREGPLNDLVNNQQIRDILKPIIDALARKIEEGKENEVLSWAEIREQIGGQLVIGIDPLKIIEQTENGCAENDIKVTGLFLFVETKEDGALTHLLASALDEESKQKDSDLLEEEIETFMGEDIYHFDSLSESATEDSNPPDESANSPQTTEEPGKSDTTPHKDSLYFGNVDDVFFAVFNLEDAHKAIETIKGDESGTLGEEDCISSIHALAESSDMYFYFRMKPIIEPLEKGIRKELEKGNDGSQNPTKPDAEALIKALGIDSFKFVSMGIRFDPEYIRFSAYVSFDSSYGIGRFFRVIGENYPTPDFIKDSTTRSINSTALNLTTFFSEAKDIFFAAIPSASLIYQAQVAQMTQVCGVNIDTDVMGAFDEGFIVSLVDNPDKAQTANSPEVLPFYAIKLKDAPTFLHNLSTLIAMTPWAASIQSKDFNGNTILSFPVPPATFSLSIKDGWLLVCPSVSVIQNLLSTNEGDKSFWQSSRYEAITSERLSAGGCGMSYCDFDFYARTLLTAFATGFNKTIQSDSGNSNIETIDLTPIQALRDLPFVICGKSYKTSDGIHSETYLYKK